MEREFCLLTEPWIRVMKLNYSIEEVSLKGLFAHAHEYRALAGELPTQDVAILRLLLAIMYAVFLRKDTEGNDSPLSDEYCDDTDEALFRWKELWDMGKFPMKPIEDYFDQYEDRFWLFHPERPFYQLPEMDIGTDYTAAKLNGELSESGNKKRLFPNVTGYNRDHLTYAQAARWLPYVIGFDDTSSKPKQKGLGSPGAGWLGKLGLIFAESDDLFRTLMMNFVALQDNSRFWTIESTTWELAKPRAQERVQIVMPKSPMALYTLQSRRIKLEREDGFVTGYRLLGGDYFEKENAYNELMTVWMKLDEKKGLIGIQPKRHNPSKQMWREFSSIFNDTSLRPGIISWNDYLRYKELLPPTKVNYHIASVNYGDKDFFVTRVFEDFISLSMGLLGDLGAGWRGKINEEVALAEKLADNLGWMMSDLNKAGGGSNDSARAKELFFFEIDVPFRRWIASIDPSGDESMNEKVDEWRTEEKRILFDLARELVDRAGEVAFVGRYVKDKNKKNDELYCAPKSYNSFIGRAIKCMEG